jgi:hypothetical protein
MSLELGRFVESVDRRCVIPLVEDSIVKFGKKMMEKGVRVARVNNLIEVANNYSVSDNVPKKTLICDINGVITPTLGKSREENHESWSGLWDLACMTDRIIFSSSGINIGDEKNAFWRVARPIFGREILPRPPFLTNQAIKYLDLFVHAANPDCETQFVIGAKEKVLKTGDKIIQSALSLLKNGKNLIIVGSNFTDRRVVNRLVDTAGKLNINVGAKIDYFDTCHLIA